MGEKCSKHRTDEKFIKHFSQKNLKGRVDLENLGIDARII
jgi:hypothetical protein